MRLKCRLISSHLISSHLVFKIKNSRNYKKFLGLGGLGLFYTGDLWSSSPFQITYGPAGTTVTSPQFRVVQNTSAFAVYYVTNISGFSLPNSTLIFNPPVNLNAAIIPSQSSCITGTGPTGPYTSQIFPNNATCSLYLTFQAPGYSTSGNNSYLLGPLTACANNGANCSTPASTQQITVNVIQDGQAYVANASDSKISIIDTSTFGVTSISTTTTASACDPQQLAVTPDGRTLYVACQNSGTVVKVDTTSLTIIGTGLTGPGYSHPWGVAVSPDAQRYFVADQGSSSGNVYVRKVSDNSAVTTLTSPAGGAAEYMTIVPNSSTGVSQLYVNESGLAGGPSTTVYAFNSITDSYSPGNAVSFAGNGSLYALSPDFNQVWVTNSGSLNVLNVGTFGAIMYPTAPSTGCTSSFSIAFNPLGFSADPYAYFGCESASVIHKYYAQNLDADGSAYGQFAVGDTPNYVAISPDGKLLFYANHNATGFVYVVSLPQGNTLAKISVGNSPYYITFLP